jgi:hypothetical protein
MTLNLSKIDKRYKASQIYLLTKEGEPVYKADAFFFINKILGPQKTWINKSPEEYFKEDIKEEAIQAIKILNFKPTHSLKEIRKSYLSLAKSWHPDKGGHDRAFNILNNAYLILKQIFELEN